MELNERKGFDKVIIFSLSPLFELLRNSGIKQEDNLWYEAIINNIVSDILESNDSSRGNKNEGHEIVLEMICNHFDNDSIGYALVDEIINMAIMIITNHIPDLDHPKYSNKLFYNLINEQLHITVTNEPRESIFNR